MPFSQAWLAVCFALSPPWGAGCTTGEGGLGTEGKRNSLATSVSSWGCRSQKTGKWGQDGLEDFYFGKAVQKKKKANKMLL